MGLQRLDLLGDCRMADIELPRGGGIAAMARRRLEGAQTGQGGQAGPIHM